MELTNQFHEAFREGLIAGYAFAATFVIIICISYGLPAQLVKNKNRSGGYKKAAKKRKLSHDQEFKQEKIKEIDSRKRKKARQIQKDLPVELLKRRIQANEIGRLCCGTSFKELCDATKHFSKESVIGVGRTGTMYKATDSNGWLLAVKRFYDSELFIKRFELELKMGRYSHRNIMPPTSFCIEEEINERFLVYQYMSNGKLSDWLNDNITALGWLAVTRIALGVARGLCCLHHSLHVVHLSIGPKSVLLGDNFEPKIYNFGRTIFIKYDLAKNIGFEKKDVYDFGTLLFELIKGTIFGKTCECIGNTKSPFATYTYATNMFEDSFGFYDAVVKSLNEIEFEDEVSALLRVACDCVHPFPCKRPTMLQVYSKMSNIWERDGIF